VHLWGPRTNCVRWGVPDPEGKKIWGSKPQPKHAIVAKQSVLCCHLVDTNERFHLLPNYSGPCYISFIITTSSERNRLCFYSVCLSPKSPKRIRTHFEEILLTGGQRNGEKDWLNSSQDKYTITTIATNYIHPCEESNRKC